MTKKILVGFFTVFILIQFFRPTRNLSTAPEPDDIFSRYPASESIKAMIRTSCYDCHSNNTKYPWYAEIQPLAWWLDHHVEEGKGELNFSDFAAFNTHYKSHKLDEIVELINEKDGVWICSFEEVKAVAYVLRDGIIKLSNAAKSQENRGDKMHLLYDYLTGTEFSEQWKAIREGYMSMRLSIHKERDAMEKMWKMREKQLDKVLINASGIKGSIEGIAGADSISLSLTDDEDETLLLE